MWILEWSIKLNHEKFIMMRENQHPIKMMMIHSFRLFFFSQQETLRNLRF